MAVLANAQTHLRQQQLGQMLEVLNAFAAELAARQGRIEEATRWLAKDGSDLTMDATPMFYVPGLAPVKVLIANPTAENLEAAQAWLARTATITVQTHNVHAGIQAQALQAILSAAQGKRAQALAVLSRAMALAENGRLLRVFADLGGQLAPLLEELQPTDAAARFLWQVRSAVANDLETSRRAARAAALEALHSSAGGRVTSSGEMVSAARAMQDTEPAQPLGLRYEQRDLRHVLTYREMDVLWLLNQRLTNKEIARQLGISTETVRQHTVKLFRKLNVVNRRQAIVVARAMGYFDDESIAR
jgi:LuxR family maltose regulon positive regulatory protein